MQRLLRYLILPSEVSSFEAGYLRRVNRLALWLFWAHVPAFMLVAQLAGTSVGLALVMALAVIAGPTLAYVALRSRPRVVSMLFGFSTMVMGAVLVYIGRGPMQIEMHFYFFVLIALLAVFANPMVVVVAAVTVAAHHVVLWLAAPALVFNYDASLASVAVHAVFVVVESIAACFVARSFFDNVNNVLGLERVVSLRTADLDAHNQAMTLILDNVAQGLVTVMLDGTMASERSQALTRWFGAPAADTRIWSYLAGHDPNLEAWMELGFANLFSGLMPASVVIDQLPTRLARGGRQFRVEYRPISEPLAAVLIVVSDVTDDLARQRGEDAQRELIGVVEKYYRDRPGFLAFLRDADDLVRRSVLGLDEPLVDVQRRIHTLKGNAALFGVMSVAALCHELEDELQAPCGAPAVAGIATLAEAWWSFRSRIDSLLGLSARRTLVVDWEDYAQVLAAIAEPEPAWAMPIRRWGQDDARAHLERFADQARQLAVRLGKAELDVEILDHGVRLEGDRFAPLWSALVHTVRNAIDHGIESTAERVAAGKPARGQLRLTTEVAGDDVVIEVRDDGAGIDWSQIAARARDHGLAATTSRELEEAVFASGVSTAAEVAETSGRGIGMGALRAACMAIGGQVEVSSERGCGAIVRCRVPLPRSTRLSQRISRASLGRA